MAATINSGGGNTTLTLVYTAPSAKFLDTVNDYIRFVYGVEDPLVTYNDITVQFSAMTNQQKADFLFYMTKDQIIGGAGSHNYARDIQAAGLTAAAENQANYGLT